MGIVGKYIDGANDAQRDRIIEAKGWSEAFYDDEDPSCRCLVGHAENWGSGIRECVVDENGISLRYLETPKGTVVFNQFPALCQRFGMDRAVQLVKQRASKGYQIPEISYKMPAQVQVKAIHHG